MSASAERYVKSDKRKVYFRTKNKYIDLADHDDLLQMDSVKILYRCFKDNVLKYRTYTLAHSQSTESDHFTVGESIKRALSRDIQFFKDSQMYDSIHILVDGKVLKIVEFKKS